MNVQAYILNISGIQTIDELREMVDNGYAHTADMVLLDSQGDYTAPKWIMRGDIVFFYHAITANQHTRRLRKEIKNGDFENSKQLLEYLDYCDSLYEKYGGKIYAVGTVSDTAYYSESGWEHPHFKTRIFAPIENIIKLGCPLSSNQFKEFLPISRHGGITPVFGNDFMKLRSLILRYNDIGYLEKCTTVSFPLKDVQKGTWIRFANENGRKYLYEEQFRKYYVDFLLMSISDDGKIYSEVSCIRNGKQTGIVDNVILFGGAYASVEIKLSAMFDVNAVVDQLKKYVDVEEFKGVCKDKDLIWDDFVILIDIFHIYIYNKNEEKTLYEIMSLNDIKCMADIRKFKDMIFEDDMEEEE